MAKRLAPRGSHIKRLESRIDSSNAKTENKPPSPSAENIPDLNVAVMPIFRHLNYLDEFVSTHRDNELKLRNTHARLTLTDRECPFADVSIRRQYTPSVDSPNEMP
jgi:hypothetical protein